ncbi:protein cortex-like isoform X2 [Onthophagus taurus]|uniref:protein cortex-like isoform X2 n=1 Tax=Onthophagus taurus TaxID=166361 RepID=UPI0039BE116F
MLRRFRIKMNENFGDRFIRSREELSMMMFHINNKDTKEDLIATNEDLKGKEYFNHGLVIHKKNNYRKNLALTLGLKIPKQTYFQTTTENWPVKSRKRPFMKEPILIRNVIDDVKLELCDWNQYNVMAGIYKRRTLVYWIPQTTECYSVESCSVDIDCRLTRRVKFNLTGNLLAIAKKNGGFFLSITNNKYMDAEIIDIKEVTPTNVITSFEWSKKDVLYAGCSDGKIFEYHITNLSLKVTQVYIPNVKEKKRILSIKLSCKENYLATSSMDKYFTVFSMDYFNVLLRAKLPLPIKCLAWHPWRECLIATQSDRQNGTLKLWNICNPKDTIEHKLDETNSKCIDYLTFNKLSGELVMSYYNTTNQICYIKVLSSFHKSTEHIEWNVGRIPVLFWSGDNKVLFVGSAGSAYSLWNFFEDPPSRVKHDFNDNNLPAIR